MPQLDKFAFFTQIFWFLLLISIFYYFFINYFVTNLSSLLKLRIKSLTRLKLDLVNETKELLDVYSIKNKNIINSLLSKINIMIYLNSMLDCYISKFSIKIKRFRKIIKKAYSYDIIGLLSSIYSNKKFTKYIWIN